MIEWFAANPVAFAAVCSMFGAIVLKIVEKWLGAKTERRNESKDYREQIKELQDRLDKVEEEVTLWRGKYYDAQVEITRLEQGLIKAGIDIPPPKAAN